MGGVLFMGDNSQEMASNNNVNGYLRSGWVMEGQEKLPTRCKKSRININNHSTRIMMSTRVIVEEKLFQLSMCKLSCAVLSSVFLLGKYLCALFHTSNHKHVRRNVYITY